MNIDIKLNQLSYIKKVIFYDDQHDIEILELETFLIPYYHFTYIPAGMITLRKMIDYSYSTRMNPWCDAAVETKKSSPFYGILTLKSIYQWFYYTVTYKYVALYKNKIVAQKSIPQNIYKKYNSNSHIMNDLINFKIPLWYDIYNAPHYLIPINLYNNIILLYNPYTKSFVNL